MALFGGGAGETVKGGTGSGDVNNRENISIYEGFKNIGASIISENWIEDYKKRYEDARNLWKEKILIDAKEVDNPFDAYAKNPFALPDGRDITEEDIKGADVAVYVISRLSGEGNDRRLAKGDYYLSEKEWKDILYLDHKNIPIVLVLNTGSQIEIADILKEASCIKAVLSIALSGQEGGQAAADVLFGRQMPCGRLTSTWAMHYEDYPFADSFSYLNGNLEKEEYREGIYVGYRYFDSFGVKPLFPFGYGLSYTSFSIEFEDIQIRETEIDVIVNVKNTGSSYSGREVVQVYITPPQTGIAKEYHRLAGFAKTDVLQPKDTQRLTITIEQKQIASFTEDIDSWIIESGKYGVWTGNNSSALKLNALLYVKETVILEHTNNICKKAVSFDEIVMAEPAKDKNSEWLALAKEQNLPVFTFKPHKEEKRYLKLQLQKSSQ